MKVSYGTREIQFTHIVNPRLKHAYIAVDFHDGVILKSPAVDEAQAGRMVLKKAAWIIEKLKLVAREPQGDIVSGSRLLYLGRKYYTQIIQDPTVSTVRVTFNHSAFKIQVPPNQPDKQTEQTHIEQKLAEFYRQKASEKLTPRISHWQQITGLTPKDIQFRQLKKSWGSSTPKHTLIFSIEVVKLPFSLIDYIIVHELCHLKHPGHDRRFRREVAKYLPTYKELETRINRMKC
jgi:predicted metal-dependent hydrolase